ncbi:XerC Integrase, partial [uncultured Caudovirales phage]
RPDSKFYWLLLEREGQPPIRRATKVLHDPTHRKAAIENKDLAEQLYHVAMADLIKRRHGIDVPGAATSFDTYAGWYLEHRTAKKITAARERSALKHLRTHLGRLELTAIDRYRVQEYLTARTKKVTASTANREVDVLKDMLAWAVPKYLPVNPLLGMKRLRVTRRGIRILSYAEEVRIKRVLQRETILKLSPVEGWALFTLAVDGFMRLGDLVALTPDQTHKTYVHVEDPKIGPYDVALSARVQRALAALRKQHPEARWIFPTLRKGKGGQAYEQQAMRWFREVCLAARVPHGRALRGVTFHSLRHTGATRFMASGGSLRDLMQQGGWADIESVMRYAHPSDELIAAVTKASRSQAPAARSSGRQSRSTHVRIDRSETRR